MQHFISVSIYRLTLAWITSENSTKQLECWHLESIFFAVAGPSLLCYCLQSPVLTAPVRGSMPTLLLTRLSAVPSPTACQLLCPANSVFVSPYHFRIRRDFRSKNPFSGFAPKQTKESSARATHIVLHTSPSYPCHLFTINYNTIQQQ